MESTQIFQSFVRNVIAALNERLMMNSDVLLRTATYAQLRTGNHPRPKQYVITDAAPNVVQIQKGFRTAITLKNSGPYGTGSELAIRITGPGQVHQTVFSNDEMEDIVLTILSLDSV